MNGESIQKFNEDLSSPEKGFDEQAEDVGAYENWNETNFLRYARCDRMSAKKFGINELMLWAAEY